MTKLLIACFTWRIALFLPCPALASIFISAPTCNAVILICYLLNNNWHHCKVRVCVREKQFLKRSNWQSLQSKKKNQRNVSFLSVIKYKNLVLRRMRKMNLLWLILPFCLAELKYTVKRTCIPSGVIRWSPLTSNFLRFTEVFKILRYKKELNLPIFEVGSWEGYT